ncbi:hypothetical protein BT96DRAFT_925214 [Gymnopus androsaceus JB14]|uniref:Uncharacterized protein n=1 Tax=Gymnopus androsaceus JB14 TaxID=1447944 RepID=A0A6A4H1R8_9AGAR|nr:hypothetical protein BT96DRAFT_925214 [Gymnopus androsaceus JB14]
MGISFSTTDVPDWQTACASKFNCTSPGLVNILGQPISFSADNCTANLSDIPPEVWGINAQVCEQYCGMHDLRQSVDFTQSAITMTTWLLPWISLIAQLPFEADGWLNILSGCLAVGSPALAAYSISLTAFNRWHISREFQRLKVMAQREIHSEYEYMIKRIDAAAFILQEAQQCPMRANQSDGQLGSLISMKDHHTDKFWEIAKKDLNNTRRGFTYSFLAQVLLAFLAYLISFISAVHDSLGSPDVGLQFATSTVWSWMFPIVFGYVRVGTQCKAGSIDEALTDNKPLPDGTGGFAYQTGLCANADLRAPQIPSHSPPGVMNPPELSSSAAESNTLHHIPVATPALVMNPAEPGNGSATSSMGLAHCNDILLSTFQINEGKSWQRDSEEANQALPDAASATSHTKFTSQPYSEVTLVPVRNKRGESRDDDLSLNSCASTSQIFFHRSPTMSQMHAVGPSRIKPEGNTYTAEGSLHYTRSLLPLEDHDARAHLLGQVPGTPEDATTSPPTWLGFDVRGDERREGSIFNYARIFTWFACAEHVQGGFRSSIEKFKKKATIPSSSKEAAEICGFSPREDLKAFMELGRVRTPIIQHILGAAFVALFIQWGTTGAAIFIAYFTPAVGLGCRSGSALIYGIAATLSWLLLVFSNVVSHTVMQRLEYNSNPRIRKSRSIAILSGIAVATRLLGKAIAIVNAAWLVAFSVMEDVGAFETCWCETVAFQFHQLGWTPVFKSASDLKVVASGIWIGGFLWSIMVCIIASTIYTYGD